MTTLALGFQTIHHKIKLISFSNINRINWRLIYIFGFLFILALLISYVFLVNELTEGTYLIKNYNKEIATLQQENADLEGGFAAAGFMKDMQQKALQLQFERTTQVKYIEVGTASLARAK